MLRVWTAIVVAVLALPAACPARDMPVDPRVLTGRLDAFEARLRELPTSGPAAHPAWAAALADLDRLAGRIELPSPAGETEKTVTTRTQHFRRLAYACRTSPRPQEFDRIRGDALASVLMLRRGLEEWRRRVGSGELRPERLDRLRSEADDILAADEFQVGRDRVGELVMLAKGRLSALFDWLGMTTPGAEVASQRVMQVVLALSIAALATIIGRAIVRRLRRPRRRRAATRRAAQVRCLAAPERHADEAREALAQARWRDAIHHSYLMVLASLERRQVILADRSRTNWEVHRRLVEAHAAEPARLMAEINRLYDRKWYGHEPVGADEAREVERLARQLVEEVAHAPR